MAMFSATVRFGKMESPDKYLYSLFDRLLRLLTCCKPTRNLYLPFIGRVKAESL
jgi:hypothetical protein